MEDPTYLQQLNNNNIFKTLVEQSPTPVGLYVGRSLIVTLVNDAILKVWDKDASVIGKTFRQALPELEGQPFYNILDNVYTTGIPYEAHGERVDLMMNGKLQTFYFNFNYKPLTNDNGEVWGILNTAADVTELVQTRRLLAENEERTRFALESAALGTWDLDPIAGTIIWDAVCKKLYGFSEGEDGISYRDVLKHIHPDDRERIDLTVQHSLNPSNGGFYDAEFRTIGAEDKLVRWLRCRGKAYFNDQGMCIRFAGTALDITHTVRDKEEQQKLINLVDNSNDMICLADMEGNITYLNKSGRDLLGRQTTADWKRPVAQYFDPSHAATVSGQLLPALLKNGRWAGEIKYRHFTNNKTIPGYVNAFRINDPVTGQPTGIAAVVRDMRPEKTAREEQDKLLRLIDYSSDFVSLSDMDGNVSYVNAAGKQMMGMQSGDSVEIPNSNFLMPDETKRLNGINDILSKKGKWAGEIIFRNFNTGEPIPIFATTMLIYDALTGTPQGRATIARDMRREIADKKALTESENLLKNITTAAPISLWMSDKEGKLIYINKTWTEWTGQTYDEVISEGLLGCILPEDRQRVNDKFIQDLKARIPHKVDFRFRRKTGAVRWCLTTGNPQYDANGDFTGYIGATIDITDKTIADIELQLINTELNDQIKQFEFVTDFMPVQLWTAKINGELDYVNQRTVDYFGLSVSEITGLGWLNNIHPDDHADYIAAWTKALQTGQLYQFEFRLKDKDGRYKWHLARALPFLNDGKIIKWFGTNTDIEEQKQMQRQKDDFLGIASHELKTPVTSIKAYAQVLGAMLSKEGESKKAAMVLKMDAQLNRLTNLIGDLLDVTKINSGRIQFNKSWFDFNQAVQDNIQDLQHTTTKHILEMDFKETGRIFSDKDRIGQVITNLITNAIKYSPHANRIIISTELKDNDVVVCVQDFGIGIPDDKKDLVFEQFYRVSGSKQHTFPGLGLGLYISSEIIKREGGKMWVNSIEGKGSTFCFALPIAENAAF